MRALSLLIVCALATPAFASTPPIETDAPIVAGIMLVGIVFGMLAIVLRVAS